MNIKNIDDLICAYNKSFLNLINLDKMKPEEQNKIYSNNTLDSNKISSLVDVNETENINNYEWASKIKNNFYYNILNENTNLYKLTFRSSNKQSTIEIKLFILPDGTIEYDELKKLEFVIGKPGLYKITIIDLFDILRKLSLEGLVDVDLTPLKTAIKVNNLNRKLNETILKLFPTKEKVYV